MIFSRSSGLKLAKFNKPTSQEVAGPWGKSVEKGKKAGKSKNWVNKSFANVVASDAS